VQLAVFADEVGMRVIGWPGLRALGARNRASLL